MKKITHPDESTDNHNNNKGLFGLKSLLNIGTQFFKGASKSPPTYEEMEKRREVKNPYARKRYGLSQNPNYANEEFLELKEYLYEQIDSRRRNKLKGGNFSPEFFRESGRIGEGRRYFYIKKSADRGWLFERSGSGWVVSRCEKIQATNTFLRGEEIWDIVNLFEHENDQNAPLRVSSQRRGGDIISMKVYRLKLLKTMGISD